MWKPVERKQMTPMEDRPVGSTNPNRNDSDDKFLDPNQLNLIPLSAYKSTAKSSQKSTSGPSKEKETTKICNPVDKPSMFVKSKPESMISSLPTSSNSGDLKSNGPTWKEAMIVEHVAPSEKSTTSSKKSSRSSEYGYGSLRITGFSNASRKDAVEVGAELTGNAESLGVGVPCLNSNRSIQKRVMERMGKAHSHCDDQKAYKTHNEAFYGLQKAEDTEVVKQQVDPRFAYLYNSFKPQKGVKFSGRKSAFQPSNMPKKVPESEQVERPSFSGAPKGNLDVNSLAVKARLEKYEKMMMPRDSEQEKLGISYDSPEETDDDVQLTSELESAYKSVLKVAYSTSEQRIKSLSNAISKVCSKFEIDLDRRKRIADEYLAKMIKEKHWKAISVANAMFHAMSANADPVLSKDAASRDFVCEQPNCELSYPVEKFRCFDSKCSNKFTTVEERNVHEKELHGRLNDTQFPCRVPNCRESFPMNPFALRVHFFSQHLCTNEHEECVFGCKTLVPKVHSRSLAEHVYSQHACPVCNDVLSSPLQDHMVTFHDHNYGKSGSILPGVVPLIPLKPVLEARKEFKTAQNQGKSGAVKRNSRSSLYNNDVDDSESASAKYHDIQYGSARNISTYSRPVTNQKGWTAQKLCDQTRISLNNLIGDSDRNPLYGGPFDARSVSSDEITGTYEKNRSIPVCISLDAEDDDLDGVPINTDDLDLTDSSRSKRVFGDTDLFGHKTISRATELIREPTRDTTEGLIALEREVDSLAAKKKRKHEKYDHSYKRSSRIVEPLKREDEMSSRRSRKRWRSRSRSYDSRRNSHRRYKSRKKSRSSSGRRSRTKSRRRSRSRSQSGNYSKPRRSRSKSRSSSKSRRRSRSSSRGKGSKSRGRDYHRSRSKEALRERKHSRDRSRSNEKNLYCREKSNETKVAKIEPKTEFVETPQETNDAKTEPWMMFAVKNETNEQADNSKAIEQALNALIAVDESAAIESNVRKDSSAGLEDVVPISREPSTSPVSEDELNQSVVPRITFSITTDVSLSEKVKWLKCKLCSYSCPPNGGFLCTICNEAKFTLFTDLYWHVVDHHGERATIPTNFECDFCGSQFDCLSPFETHLKENHLCAAPHVQCQFGCTILLTSKAYDFHLENVHKIPSKESNQESPSDVSKNSSADQGTSESLLFRNDRNLTDAEKTVTKTSKFSLLKQPLKRIKIEPKSDENVLSDASTVSVELNSSFFSSDEVLIEPVNAKKEKYDVQPEVNTEDVREEVIDKDKPEMLSGNLKNQNETVAKKTHNETSVVSENDTWTLESCSSQEELEVVSSASQETIEDQNNSQELLEDTQTRPTTPVTSSAPSNPLPTPVKTALSVNFVEVNLSQPNDSVSESDKSFTRLLVVENRDIFGEKLILDTSESFLQQETRSSLCKLGFMHCNKCPLLYHPYLMKCKNCTKYFVDIASMRHHAESVHGVNLQDGSYTNPDLLCTICQFRASSFQQFFHHRSTHFCPEHIECSAGCSLLIVGNRKDLENHIKLEHSLPVLDREAILGSFSSDLTQVSSALDCKENLKDLIICVDCEKMSVSLNSEGFDCPKCPPGFLSKIFVQDEYLLHQQLQHEVRAKGQFRCFACPTQVDNYDNSLLDLRSHRYISHGICHKHVRCIEPQCETLMSHDSLESHLKSDCEFFKPSQIMEEQPSESLDHKIIKFCSSCDLAMSISSFFKCKFCQAVFPDELEFYAHVVYDHLIPCEIPQHVNYACSACEQHSSEDRVSGGRWRQHRLKSHRICKMHITCPNQQCQMLFPTLEKRAKHLELRRDCVDVMCLEPVANLGSKICKDCSQFKEETKLYNCSLCSKSSIFVDNKEFMIHLGQNHNKIFFLDISCEICKLQFKNTLEMSAHYKHKHKYCESHAFCEQSGPQKCAFMFSSLFKSDRKHFCSTTLPEFLLDVELAPGKKRVCEDCGLESEDVKFQCRVASCSVSFVSKHELAAHRVLSHKHVVSTQFQCSDCPKGAFGFKGNAVAIVNHYREAHQRCKLHNICVIENCNMLYNSEKDVLEHLIKCKGHVPKFHVKTGAPTEKKSIETVNKVDETAEQSVEISKKGQGSTASRRSNPSMLAKFKTANVSNSTLKRESLGTMTLFRCRFCPRKVVTREILRCVRCFPGPSGQSNLFVNQEDFNLHLTAYHNDTVSCDYVCPMCGEEFLDEGAKMTHHVTQLHGYCALHYLCRKCSALFPKEDMLKNHKH